MCWSKGVQQGTVNVSRNNQTEEANQLNKSIRLLFGRQGNFYLKHAWNVNSLISLFVIVDGSLYDRTTIEH